MWYIKDSKYKLCDIRCIINGAEHELDVTPTLADNFEEAEILLKKNHPDGDLTYFHVLTEQELRERQSIEWNKTLLDPAARIQTCENLAEMLRDIGGFDREFLEQLHAFRKAVGEKEFKNLPLDNEDHIEAYMNWQSDVACLETAIKVIPFIEELVSRLSKLHTEAKERREALNS